MANRDRTLVAPAIPGYGRVVWFAGRPLLITENDYDLGIFNGETCVIIDTGSRLSAPGSTAEATCSRSAPTASRPSDLFTR
jgi:hypothetical protein